MVYSTLYCGQQGHHFLYKIAVESSLFPDGRVRVNCQFLIHLQAGEFGSCFVTFWGLEKKLNKRIKQKSFHISCICGHFKVFICFVLLLLCVPPPFDFHNIQ